MTDTERAQLQDGLGHALRHAGAPIALRIDTRASGTPEARATALFTNWNLPQDEHARAVLLYACEPTRSFGVAAGAEILRRARPAFWENLRADLTRHFGEERYCDGLFKAIADISIELRRHFGPPCEPPPEDRLGEATPVMDA